MDSAYSVKDAIEYFNGWEEGQNITITADFVAYAETLKELIKEKE